MKPSFSRVVCGLVAVRSAFDSCLAARFWWRTILWLHGKPASPTLSAEQRTQVIADGFRFYAQLYRFLALVLTFVSVAALASSVFPSPVEATYWAGAGIGGALGLWGASGIGFAGAKALRAGRPDARLLLVAFMVSIIAFLSAFVAGLSVVLQTQQISNVWLNLGLTSALWLVGVGSYFIEVLFWSPRTDLSKRLSNKTAREVELRGRFVFQVAADGSSLPPLPSTKFWMD